MNSRLAEAPGRLGWAQGAVPWPHSLLVTAVSTCEALPKRLHLLEPGLGRELGRLPRVPVSRRLASQVQGGPGTWATGVASSVRPPRPGVSCFYVLIASQAGEEWVQSSELTSPPGPGSVNMLRHWAHQADARGIYVSRMRAEQQLAGPRTMGGPLRFLLPH